MEQKDIKGNNKWETAHNKYNPYVEFADSIKQWNHFRKSEHLMLGVLGVSGCATVVILETIGAGLGSYLAMWFAVFFGFMVTWMHCELYVRIDGKDNRLNQYIHNIPLRMAFSIRDYYKEIERRLWKKLAIMNGIVFAVFLVFGIVRLFKDFLRVICLCGMVAVVFDITVVVSYFLLRYSDMRNFAICMERGKVRKQTSRNKTNFWSEHPVLLVLFCIVLVVGLTVLAGVRNYILQVPDDMEVYRSTTDWFITMYTVAICVVYGGQQVGDLVCEKGGSVKQIIGYSVVIIMALLYGCTIYTTYYEDEIVANRLFIEKEYTWDEVQSYTVKPKWISGILQLELEMEDRTLRVISSDNICSEEHADNYWDDYEYVAHLVEKMDTYGISGTLEDAEKIAPDPEFYDEESVDAFERIKAVIYGGE